MAILAVGHESAGRAEVRQEALSSQANQKAEASFLCTQELTRVVPAITPCPGKRAVEGAVQVVENPRRYDHVVNVEVGQDDLGGKADP